MVLLGAAAVLWFVVGRDDSGPPFFTESFATDSLADWSQVHRAAPDRLVRADTPKRDDTPSMRFSVVGTDVAPATPTENPRAQLNSAPLLREGDDVYVGWSTYFPGDFPADIAPWFVFFQFHGSPYSGSPRLGFALDGGRVVLKRDETYRYDEPWSTPLRTGRWLDFVLRVKWSKDPDEGFVELWYDGERQAFGDGSRRLRMATLKDDQSAVEIIPTNYRSAAADPGRVTLYHDQIEAGSSYESVAR